jgi:hypothetical protein
MTGVGGVALVTNISVALMLYRFRAGDANMRSLYGWQVVRHARYELALSRAPA